jgi:hypothetical protein
VTTTYTVTCNGHIASATVTVAGTLIDAAASYCAANGGGNGSGASPWHYNCIQAAVNVAAAGDTVFLAGGNWALNTGDTTFVTINKAINLIGVGSGNTFDVWGHISNPAQVFGATDPCPTSGTSITCVYGAGTSHGFGKTTLQGGTINPAGFISYGNNSSQSLTCTNENIAHIFFDGSQTMDGGGNTGLLNILNCVGPIFISDIRFLAFNDSSIDGGAGGETQIYFFQTSNYTVQNAVMADPIHAGGGGYNNSQTAQFNGEGSNVLVANSIFYQGGFNPIYLSNLTYTGNMQYDYNDGLGDTAINPAFGITGSGIGGQYAVYCPQAGPTTSGQCNGDVHAVVSNSLFYSGAHPFGLGGGINDPGSAGGINDLAWTGDFIFATDGEITTCESTPFNACGGMTINTQFDVSCNESANGSYGFTVTNNSIVGSTKAVLDARGYAAAGISCKLGNPYTGSTTPVGINVYGFNGQHNYLSSPSNSYVTNANTISPVQQNNFCSTAVGTVTGCAISGFTNPPSVSFSLGTLSNGVINIVSPSFTAQYGAVEWLASTTSTPPLSSDSRWIGNNSFWTSPSAVLPPSGANSLVPPIYLSGVSHGQTVYMWVKDSAGNISTAASQVLP